MNSRVRWPIAIMFVASVVSAGCTKSLLKTTAQKQPLGRPAARTGADYPAFGLSAGLHGELSMVLIEQDKTVPRIRILFNRSMDYGATWLRPVTIAEETKPNTQLSLPAMWLDATEVSLAWRRKSGADKTIYFAGSTDRGQTWPAEPVGLIRNGQPFAPIQWADPGGHRYIFWQDEARSIKDLKFMASGDAGATWPAQPILLTAHLAATGKRGNRAYARAITSDQAGRVYVAWHEKSLLPSLSHRLVLNRSADFGQSWLSEPVTIRDLPGSEGHNIGSLSLVADAAGHVYLAWEEPHPDGSDIYITRSDDSGTTWPYPPIRLNSTSPSVVTIARQLRLATGPTGTLYAAWTERVSEARKRIAFRQSTDFGSHWGSIRFLDGDAPEGLFSENPSLKADATGRVYAAWEQWYEREGWPEWRVFFTRSEDRGATWLREPIRLDTLPQSSSRLRLKYPRLFADREGTVYVVWQGDPFGREDGFLNRSRDYGRTWLSKEQWLTDPSAWPPGESKSAGIEPPR